VRAHGAAVERVGALGLFLLFVFAHKNEFQGIGQYTCQTGPAIHTRPVQAVPMWKVTKSGVLARSFNVPCMNRDHTKQPEECI